MRRTCCALESQRKLVKLQSVCTSLNWKSSRKQSSMVRDAIYLKIQQTHDSWLTTAEVRTSFRSSCGKAPITAPNTNAKNTLCATGPHPWDFEPCICTETIWSPILLEETCISRVVAGICHIHQQVRLSSPLILRKDVMNCPDCRK